MKRYISAATKKQRTAYIFSSTELSDREEILLEWAGDSIDPGLSLDEQIRQAEEIAEENGWTAFDSADKEFEHFWDVEDGDIKRVFNDFDVAYGNGERLYPMDYQNGAQEAFYEWVKKNHPEADTSSISVDDGLQFTDLQLRQIKLGRESGVDVSWYANPKFDSMQMKQIRLGLESKLDVSIYADPKFDSLQMEEIRLGLESGLDVSEYANLKYDTRQMRQIKKGLESGLDISWYADPKFDGMQMTQIREGLESGLDISWYADPKFDWEQMWRILEGLELGLDVSQYADPKLDADQMKEIRQLLEQRE